MGQGLFFCINHQTKARSFIEALISRGYRKTLEYDLADFFLMDLDVLSRRTYFDQAQDRNIPAFIYPHAARPQLAWDGIHEPHPRVTRTYVVSDGHQEILRRYGYPHSMKSVGWSYCGIKPFVATGSVKRILFGPIHANANGFLAEIDRKINQAAHQRLLDLKQKNPHLIITIRFIGDFHGTGLSYLPDKFQYVRGRPDLTTVEIDKADLVIGHQTFAYLSVARGRPTLMMAEDETPRSGNSLENFTRVQSWDKYKDLLMYPLDFLAVDDPWDLIEHAVRTDVKIRDWRSRIIGEPFDAQGFVSDVESFL